MKSFLFLMGVGLLAGCGSAGSSLFANGGAGTGGNGAGPVNGTCPKG
jgi:hypothetical protein